MLHGDIPLFFLLTKFTITTAVMRILSCVVLLSAGIFGCKNGNIHEERTKSEESSNQTQVVQQSMKQIPDKNYSSFRIGAINLDTLIVKSKVISRHIEEIQGEAIRLQNQLNKKYEQFQKDMEEYNARRESMSRAEQLLAESKLKKQMEEIEELRQKYTEYFAGLQARKEQTALEYLRSAADSIARRYNLTMVFTYGAGANILYVVDSIDYTQQVIQIIDEYAGQSKKNK